MLAKFESQIAVGTLTVDEMRAVMKTLGMSYWDLDRAMGGDAVDWHGARSTALKALLRREQGSPDLRRSVHATLIEAAGKHVDFLVRNLRADLSFQR